MICHACRQAGLAGRTRLLSLASRRAVSMPAAPVLSPPRMISSCRPRWTNRTTAAVPAHRAACRAAGRPFSQAAENAAPPNPSSPPKPDFLDAAESHIWDLLCEAFAPVELSVRDISGGCGSMYGIEISSDKFRGANMLKQQRMVNAVLGDMMKTWHGVQLKTRVP